MSGASDEQREAVIRDDLAAKVGCGDGSCDTCFASGPLFRLGTGRVCSSCFDRHRKISQLNERIVELERDLHESSGVIEGLMTADDLSAAREIVAELLITQRDSHRSDQAMAGSCLCRHCRAHRFVAGERPRALLDGGLPRLDALREIIHRNEAAAVPPLRRVTLGDIQQVESFKRQADAGLCGMCGMAACGCVADV